MGKKKFRPWQYAVVLAFSFLINSCQKPAEHPDITILPQLDHESSFFTDHPSSDVDVNAALDFVRNHNEQFDFSHLYAERIGLPYWSKSIVMKKDDTPQKKALVFIPFVRPGEDRVSAAMLVRISKADTSFRMIYASKASIKESSSTEARLSAILLMSLDKKIFGHERFQITDEKLMESFGFETGIVKLPSVPPSLAGRMVYYTIEICYEIEIPRNNGQLTGCPPDAPCPQYETHTRCDIYSGWYDDGSDYGGGGGGNDGIGGSGGGGGGGNTPPPNPYPCPPVQVYRLPSETPPCPDGPVYVPIPGYSLSADDIRIFAEMEAEDAAVDALNMNCQGTNRTGNIQWPGTVEHWLIMVDYINRNPNGQVEYQIPGSSANGNTGYADIANSATAEIFEIKPNNPSGLAAGQTEVARYVTQANIHCAASSTAGPWKEGNNYVTRLLPDAYNPLYWIEASLIAPGVVGYKRVPRATNPLPAPLPVSVTDKLKALVRKLNDKPNEWKNVIAEYLRQNPDLVTYIKGAAYTAAVGIIVGTIIEDIVTLGGGIADDWICFLTAYRIVRFAWKL